MKHKDTYKAYTKLKKSKQEDFYNEHTAEIILFESAKKISQRTFRRKQDPKYIQMEIKSNNLEKRKKIVFILKL